MSYQVIVDSVCDLPLNLVEEWGLITIPYIFSIDGKEYYNHLDYRDLSVKAFYDIMRTGKLGATSQVTAHRYIEAWRPFLEEGKDVLQLCMSSGVTKSYDQAMIAIEEIKKDYPDRKVIPIDTRSGCLGLGILTYYVVKARDEGKNIQELAEFTENLKPKVNHWIMPDDLNHLRRSGRVTGAAAFIGTMLSVKPILHMTADGRMTPIHKARGTKKGLMFFIDQMVERGFDPKESIVAIAHADTMELVGQIKEMIINKFGECEFLINEVGPVIGTHVGPNTISIMFLGKDRYS